MNWHLQVRGGIPRCEAASRFIEPELVIIDAALEMPRTDPVGVQRRPYRCGFEDLVEACAAARIVQLGYPDVCVVSGACERTPEAERDGLG